MNKLLSALIAGVFATGVAIAADAPKPVDLKPAPAAQEAPAAESAKAAKATKKAKKVKKSKKAKKV